MLREQRLEIVEDRSNASLRKSVIQYRILPGSTRATRPAIVPARASPLCRADVCRTDGSRRPGIPSGRSGPRGPALNSGRSGYERVREGRPTRSEDDPMFGASYANCALPAARALNPNAVDTPNRMSARGLNPGHACPDLFASPAVIVVVRCVMTSQTRRERPQFRQFTLTAKAQDHWLNAEPMRLAPTASKASPRAQAPSSGRVRNAP